MSVTVSYTLYWECLPTFVCIKKSVLSGRSVVEGALTIVLLFIYFLNCSARGLSLAEVDMVERNERLNFFCYWLCTSRGETSSIGIVCVAHPCIGYLTVAPSTRVSDCYDQISVIIYNSVKFFFCIHCSVEVFSYLATLLPLSPTSWQVSSRKLYPTGLS